MKTYLLLMAKRLAFLFTGGLVFLFIINLSLTAQTQVAKITAEDGTAGRFFGNPVAIYENTIIVGVSFEDSYGFASGAAYIFRNQNGEWVQEAKLIGSGIDAYDFFGTSVDIGENVAIIGASGDQGSGAAFIYRYNGSEWNEDAKLVPSDGLIDDLFGSSVAIKSSGKTALVGAPGDYGNRGSVYIFEYENNSWVEKDNVYASGAEANDKFGIVSISDTEESILIAEKGFLESGEVHVFMQDGTVWVRVAKLLPIEGSDYDNFGYNLDKDDEIAVVGARKDNGLFLDCGSAHIYRKEGNSWKWQTKIMASDVTEDQRFGTVAVSENVILVGATHDDENGMNAGAAYIFKHNGITWKEEAKILADDGFAEDWFGSSVDLYGNTAVIGAPYDNDQGASSGAVYVFDLSAITGTIKIGGRKPQNYVLEQNYPNPFNPSTTIKYSIPKSERVLIKVFDFLGREITTLVDEEKQAGNYEVVFTAENFASGVYMYKMQAGEFVITRKFILMK